MNHLPPRGHAGARAPQLPVFHEPPAWPLEALPRTRRHRRPRLATITLGECSLLVVLSLAVGIAAGSFTNLPVPTLQSVEAIR